MVSRIELILAGSILIFLFGDFTTAPAERAKRDNTERKTLALSSVTLYEVNETGVRTVISAEEMVRYPDKTSFENLKLVTPELIVDADTAVMCNGIFYLEKQTTIYSADGTQYQANQAQYDKKNTLLTISGPFRAIDDQGTVSGEQMLYNASSKVLRGSHVQAEYEMLSR